MDVPVFSLETLMTVLCVATGFLVGENFARFDYEIQRTRWFKSLSPFKKWFVKSVLDACHHFQYGLLLMVLSYYVAPYPNMMLYCLGLGIVLSDLRDLEQVIRRLKKYARIFG